MSFFDKVMIAGSRGGWWLLAVGVLVALGLVWLAAFNPVEEAVEEGGEAAGRALGIVAGQCPDGWKSIREKDEHGKVRGCFLGDDLDHPQAGDWIVALNDEGFFDHAIQVDTPGARIVEDPALVPRWPR